VFFDKLIRQFLIYGLPAPSLFIVGKHITIHITLHVVHLSGLPYEVVVLTLNGIAAPNMIKILQV